MDFINIVFLLLIVSIVLIVIGIAFYYLIVPKLIENNNKKFKELKPLIKYEINEEKFIENLKNPIIPIMSNFSDKNKIIASPSFKTRSFGHTLIVGGSGTGKTTRLVEPLIYFNAHSEAKPSMLIPDSSPDTSESLYNKYYSYLISQGYDIKVLNLNTEKMDLNEEYLKTDYFNPMNVIWKYKDDNDVLNKKVEEFVNTIIPQTDKDDHWILSARNITIGFILYMIESGKYSDENFNIANLSYLLTKKFKTIAIELEDINKYSKSNSYTRLHLESMYFGKREINKEIASIISTINSKVQIFKRPIIHTLSTKSTINFDEINKKPTAIFIKSKFEANDSSSLAFISLFIQNIADYWMSQLDDNRDLIVLGDEFNSYPVIEKLATWLERGRKHRLWLFIILQSASSFFEKYKRIGKGLSLSNFYNHIILQTSDKDDIQLLLEKFQQEEDNLSSSSSNKGYYSTSRGTRIKEAILSSDIKTLHGKEGIAVMRGVTPFKTHLDIIDNLEIEDILKASAENKANWIKKPEINIVEIAETTPIKSDKAIKKQTRIEFEEFKKQLLNAFSVVLKSNDKAEFKHSFVDKINYELWQKTDKGLITIWKDIHDEFLKLYSTDHEFKESLKLKLASLAPDDVRETWFNVKEEVEDI